MCSDWSICSEVYWCMQACVYIFEVGRVREEKRREEERRLEKRKSQKKEDAGAWKGRKVATHSVFQWFVAPEGRRLAKAAGVEPPGEMRDEKLHAILTRSPFPSQNLQSTPAPEHFWKLRCSKSARRCGAKHMSKSQCTKHLSFGELVEVRRIAAFLTLPMSKTACR